MRQALKLWAAALGAHQGEACKLDRYRAAVTAVKGQKLVC